MDRRRFLVGLGVFAGTAIALPEVPRVIVDMGRAQVALPDALTDLIRHYAIDFHRAGLISTRTALDLAFIEDMNEAMTKTIITSKLAQYGSWVRVSDLAPQWARPVAFDEVVRAKRILGGNPSDFLTAYDNRSVRDFMDEVLSREG